MAIRISPVVSPEEHRPSAGPSIWWPAISKNALWSRLLSVGRWEGDLIIGSDARSAIGSVVDRTTRPR